MLEQLMPTIHPASDAEREIFLDHCALMWGCEAADLPDCYLGVIPKYMSDGPGYIGILYVAVWAGGPECVTICTRKGDDLKIVCNHRL